MIPTHGHNPLQREKCLQAHVALILDHNNPLKEESLQNRRLCQQALHQVWQFHCEYVFETLEFCILTAIGPFCVTLSKRFKKPFTAHLIEQEQNKGGLYVLVRALLKFAREYVLFLLAQRDTQIQ